VSQLVLENEFGERQQKPADGQHEGERDQVHADGAECGRIHGCCFDDRECFIGLRDTPGCVPWFAGSGVTDVACRSSQLLKIPDLFSTEMQAVTQKYRC
jgi:hypothetical protein